MLYNFQKTKLCKHLLVGGALFAVGFGMNSCTDTYDLDTEQPSGLNSIYGYIQDRGNFQNYMRIIKDLGQEEILSKTGSKTLFLANDAAFEEFYRSNDWGVSCYDELSMTQMKILLGAAMIDNPYTTSMLSTASGPVRGEVCRRVTSQSLYDTIDVIPAAELSTTLPATVNWETLRNNNKDVVLFRDASMAPPTVHFTPKFLQMNKLTSSDLEFLYRLPEGSLISDDVYVGRAKITNPNIFCKNGFIHEVDRVMVPLDNMAEILRKSENDDPNKSAKIYSNLIERFAAPWYDATLQSSYEVLQGGATDSVFVKRYFSKRSADELAFEEDIFLNAAEATLKFDPGWNAYTPTAFSNRNALMEDMAVILAPTDQAMSDWWWGEGSGKLLRSRYGGSEKLENVPSTVVAELLNNNFLEQLTLSLPSKFNETVYDDANEIMGLTTDHISDVSIGCNGVIYYTDKVYEPATFRSVLYPVVVNSDATTNVIYNIIDQLDYKAYLNSMVSRYSLFYPTNKGLLTYIDPVSYGKQNRELWTFEYDETASSESQKLIVKVYRLSELTYDPATRSYNTDEVSPRTTYKNPSIKGSSANAVVVDRLEDILDNIIVIGEITTDQEYYPTKGRSYLRVKTDGTTVDPQSGRQVPNVVSVSGSWQDQGGDDPVNTPLEIASSSVHDNGYSYEVKDGTPVGGSKSVVDILADMPECSLFYEMVKACATSATVTPSSSIGWVAASNNGNLISSLEPGEIGNEDGAGKKIAYLLNGYHYTVYAPTNDAMQKAFDLGLPSLDDLTAAEEYDGQQPDEVTSLDHYRPYADSLRAVMLDFIKLHIQDNSVYVDNGFESGDYESSKIELVQSYNIDGNTGEKLDPAYETVKEDGVEFHVPVVEPRKPYKLTVNVSKDDLSVRVKNGDGTEVHVKKFDAEGKQMYNLQAREYWLDKNGGKAATVEDATTINTVSSAVVHAVDGVLLYDTSVPTDENGGPVYHKLSGKEIKCAQFQYVRRKLSTSK